MTNKTANLPETQCQIGLRRGLDEALMAGVNDDDMVLVVKGAYKTLGKMSKNAQLATNDAKYKDTRVLATTPGMFAWQAMGLTIGQHPSGRKVGVKLTLMLSSPLAEQKAKGEKAERNTSMSEMI